MDHAGGGKRMKRRKSGDAQRPQSNLYERKRGKAKSKEKPNDAPSPPERMFGVCVVWCTGR